MNRQAMLDALTARDERWDVVVIGGGATGLGAALDAASRGYRTAVIEASDFAKGTSSRSTKLIHGGVRYLQQGQIRMVRDSLLERGRLQHNAPHIVHARQFVIPAYQTGRRYYYYAGLKVYDILAGKLGFEAARLLSAKQTLDALPTLKSEGLRGGVSYADGQFDDARLAIALVQTFVDCGGIAVNYTPVVRLLASGGRMSGLVARDTESGQEFELRAKVIINATGVFSESILRMDETAGSASAGGTQRIGTQVVASQGTHIVLPREFLPSRTALLIPHTDDSRVLFAIPWQGRTLFGTTDNRVQDIVLEPRALAGEVEYLLAYAGRYLTRQPTRADILSVFAGLRPLVGKSQGSQATSKLSREHEILTSPTGLISVIGGKWTTYRKMGQDVVDLAARVGSLPQHPSQTATLALHGTTTVDEVRVASSAEDVLDVYGNERQALLDSADREPGYNELLSARLPYLVGQVAWAVEHEMARTIEDVLSRRTRGLLLDARASLEAAPKVAEVMQKLLNQTSQWSMQQLRDFSQLASGYVA